MFRAGVPLLAGTDTGNPYCFPGFSLHDELALLVESGLTPLAALQSATVNAATFMNTSDRYGTIAPGKIADLLLLDADPLKDIHNTTKIAEVFLAGKEFNRHDLDAILSTAASAANAKAEQSGSAPQVVPEIQGLESALAGRWSITEKFEPDERTPNGGTGYGEEVWRRGPGGFTFMEEIHDHTPFGEGYGVGFSWWDETKGLQGLWCINTNPQGCDLQSAVSGFGPKWDGKQLVVDTEFPRNGKKLAWHEVFSDITAASFTQTADIGEKGGPLKRWLTINATRVATEAGEPSLGSTNNNEQPVSVSPSPEMQKLFAAQLGRWYQREEGPDGSTGEGESLWRPGPGGMSLIEDEYMRRTAGDMVGLSVTWWDDAVKGYGALWCDNKIKNGCLVMSKPAHWEGDKFVLGDEFERDGKKLVYKEVESGITPTTYTLTSYIGEPGGELRPTSTIHSIKINEGSIEHPREAANDTDFRAALAKRHQAMIDGDEDVVDRLTAKEYAQTDIFGHVQDKAAWMSEYFRPLAALMKSGKFRWERYEERDVHVTMLGDTAVVTGELAMRGIGAKFSGGKPEETPHTSIEGTLRFTRVWINRDGVWLLAALHNAAPLGVQSKPSRP